VLEQRVEQATIERNETTDAALKAPSAERIGKAEAARTEFSKLHGYSMTLKLVTILLVTVTMALTARLPSAVMMPAEPSPNGLAVFEPQAVSAGAASSSTAITTG
jgi:hypothetical protein